MLAKDSKNAVLSFIVDKPKRAMLILQPQLITNESAY